MLEALFEWRMYVNLNEQHKYALAHTLIIHSLCLLNKDYSPIIIVKLSEENNGLTGKGYYYKCVS